MNSSEIAQLAGVSRRSVTRVLNNPESVHKKTRDKILKVIEEYKYYPNASARRLSSKKAHMLGLFIVQDFKKSRIHTDDMIFGPVIGSIINAAAVRGYHVITSIIDITDSDDVLKMFAEKSIDGGVFISWGLIDHLIEAISAGGYPLAVFDQNSIQLKDAQFPITVIDNYLAAEQAVNYLLELGHRNIATVTGSMSVECSKERLEGYHIALRNYGVNILDNYIYHGDFSEDSGERAAQFWLKKKRTSGMPTAIFAANDLMAIGLLRAFHEQGVRVPEDISVIGFDDVLVARYSRPPLTTVRVPRVDMASALTDRLLNVIENYEDNKASDSLIMTYSTELIVRESCRSLSSN